MKFGTCFSHFLMPTYIPSSWWVGPILHLILVDCIITLGLHYPKFHFLFNINWYPSFLIQNILAKTVEGYFAIPRFEKQLSFKTNLSICFFRLVMLNLRCLSWPYMSWKNNIKITEILKNKVGPLKQKQNRKIFFATIPFIIGNYINITTSWIFLWNYHWLVFLGFSKLCLLQGSLKKAWRF